MAIDVYLTYVEQDSNHARILPGLVRASDPDLEFKTFSAKGPYESRASDRERQIIRDWIRRSNAVVCIIGAHTAQSRWVDWELREAIALLKPVVGVRVDPWQMKIPRALTDALGEVVDWNPGRVARAVSLAMARNTEFQVAAKKPIR